MKRDCILITLLLAAVAVSCTHAGKFGKGDDSAERILLKDYKPHSIFNVKETEVLKAKFPVIDMHSHDYVDSKEGVEEVVACMDRVGVEVSHIMHCNWIGDDFDTVVERYSGHTDRFRFWCCIDYTDFCSDGWEEKAIAKIMECRAKGAVGIGELVDKGFGDVYARPVPGEGIRLNDPKVMNVLRKVGELGMPVSVHIAEPIWMYEKIDCHNDGLMNGAEWQIDTTREGCIGYEALMEMFEDAVAGCPGTIFIADHLLNMSHDLPRLGEILDRHENLYIDISGRFAETSVTPRATREFMIKYQDRVLYGTDNSHSDSMYRETFRLMETADEHIYLGHYYHWSAYGWDLPDDVLEKIYRTNALKMMKRQ